jgi:hypothetical protein
LFEHLLPYKHDHDWWASFDTANLQINLPALMRYSAAHRGLMDRAAMECKRRIEVILRSSQKRTSADGVVIKEEPFDIWYRDGQALFAEHCVHVGEDAGSYLHYNFPLARKMDAAGVTQIMTARINGRMLGYLATLISPSLKSETEIIATHTTFFAGRDARGLHLGERLQKAANDRLMQRGIREVNLRAGVVGSGPKMGALYARMGAVDDGHLYRLRLGDN